MKSYQSDSRQLGNEKESLAAKFLTARGIRLKERNYQCRFGEIDLIACDHEFLIFVEVRFRSSSAYGTSAETVDKVKQGKIILCARHYLLTHSCHNNFNCRFDVIGINNGARRGSHNIQWIRDAFQT
ncbi:MAG: YraN family protein [Gammaproteobacteria bacterium]|nr:YraN family protein [Gammaproteobacteria bacterium]